MLKNLLSPELPETPTLREWREHALRRLLLIALVLMLLPIAVDTIGAYQRGHIELIVFNIAFYAILIFFVFVRSIPFQARVFIIIGIWLGFNGYILMYLGLVSSGRVGLFAIVMLAALLLGRRQTLVVWFLSAVTAGVSLTIFFGQPADSIALVAARLNDPNTLLTQGLLVISVSGFIAVLALSLQSSFGKSLQAAEEALAERDRLNAALEQRVAERTARLEQALASLHASEVKYRTLFQTMPAGITIIDERGQLLESNLVGEGIGDPLGAAGGEAGGSVAQLIGSDGDPMATSAHPGVRAIRERYAIRDIEVGLHQVDSATSWYAVTAAPLNLPGYGAMIVYNDITARKTVEQMLKRQLQMQAAIVRSSQMLLDSALSDDAQQHLLMAALETLYAAINTNPIYLLRNIDDPQKGLSARIVIHVGPADRVPLCGQQIPWEDLPAGVRHSMESGSLWLGPIQEMLPPQPWVRQIFYEQAIYSILCLPIFVDQVWWGAIFFADQHPDRVWGAHETLLLHTFADIIGATLKRWQTEVSLSQQLRYAETLARSSQLLLNQGGELENHDSLVRSVLSTLREVIAASYMVLYQRNENPVAALPYTIIGMAHAPGLPPPNLPSPEQIDVPPELGAILDAGQVFNGPVIGRFPANPRIAEAFAMNRIKSALMIPIFLDGKPWGMIEATDNSSARTWDASSVQLLRTAAEMLATAQQGWETTRALAEREHFIQRVMQSTPDIIYVFNLATRRTVYINHELAPMVGYSPSRIQVDGVVMSDLLLDDEDLARLEQHRSRLVAGGDGAVTALEYRVRLANGEIHWVLSRDQIFMHDGAGRPSQILSIAQDITERKMAEQALSASEAHMRALRDALPDLLFVVRADGTILDYHAPPQVPSLISPEVFLGKSIMSLFPKALFSDAIIDQVQAAMSQVLTVGGVATFEYQQGLGDEQRAYEARVVLIVSDTLLFVVHDITERQQATDALLRAKEAAESADRAKSTFLAHMSHEIRTPLTAIIGMASLLAESPLNPSQRESAAIIRTSGETLLNLIGNILDFSKIEAGQFDLVAQPFDLQVICQAAINLVSHTAARKGLGLTFQMPPDMPAVVIGDSGRLHQVLVNLLSNAVKFTWQGTVWLILNSRKIDVELYEIQLIVRDTGIGIASTQLDQIFLPFVQVERLLTRQESGTGLGLTISQHLAKLMGGRLEVESALGVGTTFTLTLPVAVAAALPSSREVTAAHKPITTLRVLIAEDNLINREVLLRMLEQLGVAPVVVGDGEAALAAVRVAPYDLVLMDIQMPIMDGETATRRIRCLGAEIAQPYIVALTASALRGDRERYIEAGMNDYLSKPVQLGDLQRVLTPHAHSVAPVSQEADPTELLSWQAIRHLISSFQMPVAQTASLVADLYERELLAQIVAVTSAAQANDRPLVARLSHKLRGGSRQLGATALAAMCTVLESAAQHPDSPAIDGEIAQLHSIYQETWALLHEHIRSLD